MKLRIFFCTIVLFVIVGWNVTFAKKVMTLPGLADPAIVSLKDGKVYVSDSKINKLFIYSLKDFRLLKQLLNKGSGPQECQYYPDFQVLPDCLFLFTILPDKVMIFSKDGVYKNEFRVPINGLNSFYPVGKNYVACKSNIKKGNPISYIREFSIYTYENKAIKLKKLFYCIDKPAMKHEGNKEVKNLIQDYTDFIVSDNKVFLGDSKLGLYILIFDSNGNQIGRIKIPDEKIEISEQYKKDYIETGKKLEPVGYAMAAQMQKFTFPEYFPAFFRFAVDKGKVYFLTYKIKGNQREVIVADFKGEVLKKAFVPMTKMGRDETFAIENDKYYYILENEDTEEYELHVADIK